MVVVAPLLQSEHGGVKHKIVDKPQRGLRGGRYDPVEELPYRWP